VRSKDAAHTIRQEQGSAHELPGHDGRLGLVRESVLQALPQEPRSNGIEARSQDAFDCGRRGQEGDGCNSLGGSPKKSNIVFTIVALPRMK